MRDLDRSARPAPSRIRPYQFPDLEARRLDTGLEVMLVRKKDLPMVTALVVLDAGETRVPMDRAGLAALTADVLEGGTERRSGLDWVRALEAEGATFGTGSGWDSTTAAVSCQADRLGEVLPLLAEMVREPAFPEDEVERFRQQRLGTIRQRQMNPAALASDAFSAFLFGDGSPFGRPLGGMEDTVGALGSFDCRGFARKRYGPRDGGLILVGDVEPREAGSLAQECFGDWAAQNEEEPARGLPARDHAGVLLVHRPGAVQSEIRIGHAGICRTDEQYFTIQVLNLILGGSFTSRLNLNLRERNGYTYGIRSRFLARRSRGPFLVSTAVETGVTGSAVAEIHREISALASEGPSDAEVESARSYLSGVFPLKLETTGQIASQAADLIVYDLERDYYHTYRDRIRAVSVEDVVRAAQTTLRPAELRTVIVGDADAVEAQLEDQSLGPVERG
ncbi:MAG: insulinase family protein [Gemmatimonadetes bacterium]|nr:insulinase family protein [Gemmatimonadota bacterium]